MSKTNYTQKKHQSKNGWLTLEWAWSSTNLLATKRTRRFCSTLWWWSLSSVSTMVGFPAALFMSSWYSSPLWRFCCRNRLQLCKRGSLKLDPLILFAEVSRAVTRKSWLSPYALWPTIRPTVRQHLHFIEPNRDHRLYSNSISFYGQIEANTAIIIESDCLTSVAAILNSDDDEILENCLIILGNISLQRKINLLEVFLAVF